MKKIMRPAVVLILSSVAWAQGVQNPGQGGSAKQQTFKDIIDNVKTVSPDAAANLLLMRQIITQEPVTGSGYLRGKVEPFKGVAYTALHDFVTGQLSADLLTAKSTNPQAAKDVVRALGDLVNWGGRAAQDFAAANIKDIGATRPFGSFLGYVYPALDTLIFTSADSDWPSLSAIIGNDKGAELQALEAVSPKGVKDILMTRALVKQAPTTTGNAAVDQQIADAKTQAVESLRHYGGMELLAGLLIARENEDKNVPAALKVISGPKYATDKVAFEEAFNEGVQVGPKLGNVNMLVWGWLAPEIRDTVIRLTSAGPSS
jgi:hypothetical protein